MTSVSRQDHDERVLHLQEQIKSFAAKKQKIKIYHGNTNSTRPQSFHKNALVDVSGLNNVIEVNVNEAYALVEPNVAMDELLEATHAQGMMPEVVTEFPGITVGGAVMGGAGESSSHKYGCFHETCLEYEVLDGKGALLTLNPQVNNELFCGIACSYGSLGIITLIKLRLVPASPYVQLRYLKVGSFKEAVKRIEDSVSRGYDFVDGIMFTRDQGVVVVGNLCDQEELPLTKLQRPFNEWFYLHARKVTGKAQPHEEIIPLKDYLFRYDRGAFWTGRFAFSVLHLPFNRLFRILLSPLLKTRTLFRFLHGSNLSQRFLVQDACMPSASTVEFLEFVDDNFGIYPLWLCPLRKDPNNFLSPTCLDSDLVINVGIYGDLNIPYEDYLLSNRKLENKVASLKGRKVLYAHSYYPKGQYWDIYDLGRYARLRNEFNSKNTLMDIFDKISAPKKTLKPSLTKGWLNLLFSSRTVRQSKATAYSFSANISKASTRDESNQKAYSQNKT